MTSSVERAAVEDYYFFDPEEFPPPFGKHLQLLTPSGCAVIGIWSAEYAGWDPVPRIPSSLKRKLARLRGDDG